MLDWSSVARPALVTLCPAAVRFATVSVLPAGVRVNVASLLRISGDEINGWLPLPPTVTLAAPGPYGDRNTRLSDMRVSMRGPIVEQQPADGDAAVDIDGAGGRNRAPKRRHDARPIGHGAVEPVRRLPPHVAAGLIPRLPKGGTRVAPGQEIPRRRPRRCACLSDRKEIADPGSPFPIPRFARPAAAPCSENS